jgi:type IV pilus assembly protein PilN
MVLGASIGFVHSKISEEISLSNARIQQMQRDIDQYKPQLDQVVAFRAKKSELENKIGVIEELDHARSGPVRLLSELASRTPERLWLTSLSTKGSVIMMKGQSLDNDLLALFLRRLGESAYFEDVDLDKTELGNQRGGLRLMNFSVRAVLVNPDASSAANEQSVASAGAV